MATQPRQHSENVPQFTRFLAESAVNTRYEDLPADITEIVRQCLLDWFGVTIAGASEPLVRILAEEVAEQGGAKQATLIVRGNRVSAAQAALVNGAASHALDYDDVHPSMTGHPTVVLVPALLALAEKIGANGREIIAAYVAGYETMCRLGVLMNPSHYDIGFHSTATMGSVASAAACARLLQLDVQRTAYAIGIAATQAAGLKSMFGTMCKPLHAGKAAQNGVLAASLASRGFDSRDDAIECRLGFARTLNGDFRAEAALADPPRGYFLYGNLFKYHAACYLTHAPIECALRLRAEHGMAAEAIESVTVRVNPGCDTVCNIQTPETGLEAKFSLRMTVAFALAGVDTAAIASYTEENCRNSGLVALRDKVRVEFSDKLGRMASEVEIALGGGRRVSARHDASVAEKDLARQRKRLEAKFHALVDPIFGAVRSQEIIAGLNRDSHLLILRCV